MHTRAILCSVSTLEITFLNPAHTGKTTAGYKRQKHRKEEAHRWKNFTEGRMSLPRTFTLLFLGLVITSFFTDAQADSCLLTSTTSNSNYSLTVSPQNLIKGTLYTVTLSSNLNGSVDFLLQASASNSAIGNWSMLGTYSNCANGVSVSSYAISTSNSFIANWTSPSTLSVNSVSISAFVNNSMGVFMIGKNLTVAATTTSATTAKTTPKSGGPANDPSSLVLTLCLLVITSKFLS